MRRCLSLLFALLLCLPVVARTSVSGRGSPPPVTAKLKPIKTLYTRHGNAAHLTWSDDGKILFLANEEGRMSAVKIDASNPTKPRIVATNGDRDFLWTVAQRGGLLAFHQSYGGDLMRVDPHTLKTLWIKDMSALAGGLAHDIDTDGSRLFVPVEAEPGQLVVLDTKGEVAARLAAPEGWADSFSAKYDPATQRLYVAVGPSDPPTPQFPGGVYIYDVKGRVPILLGKIAEVGEVAPRGPRLYMVQTERLLIWDVSDPRRPKILGQWRAPKDVKPEQGEVQMLLMGLDANKAGTQAYVSFGHTGSGAGQIVGYEGDWKGGFLIFDTSGPTPRELARQEIGEGHWFGPAFLALSPDQKVLATPIWAFGVLLWNVAHDRVAALGQVATTGEARDVYVDRSGLVYAFAHDDIQIIDPNTGEHTDVIWSASDGGWQRLPDGSLLLAGFSQMRLEGGKLTQDVWLGNPIPDEPYVPGFSVDGKTVYVAAEAMGVHVLTLSGTKLEYVTGRTLDHEASAQSALRVGNYLWVLTDQGVTALNVATLSTAFTDTFSWNKHGFPNVVSASGRVYVAAGDQGVMIYDPVRPRRTGRIYPGANENPAMVVNFLDALNDRFLVLANYWQTEWPEGVYVYDLRPNPDVPTYYDRFPNDNSANFRVRVFGGRIYRVPLYGVDILELR